MGSGKKVTKAASTSVTGAAPVTDAFNWSDHTSLPKTSSGRFAFVADIPYNQLFNGIFSLKIGFRVDLASEGR